MKLSILCVWGNALMATASLCHWRTLNRISAFWVTSLDKMALLSFFLFKSKIFQFWHLCMCRPAFNKSKGITTCSPRSLPVPLKAALKWPPIGFQHFELVPCSLDDMTLLWSLFHFKKYHLSILTISVYAGNQSLWLSEGKEHAVHGEMPVEMPVLLCKQFWFW